MPLISPNNVAPDPSALPMRRSSSSVCVAPAGGMFLTATVPPVEALLAARAGFARGAYEAARQAALGGSAAGGYTGPFGGYT